MSQCKPVLEVKNYSKLYSKEPPLLFEPRLLRSPSVKRNIQKDFEKKKDEGKTHKALEGKRVKR